MPKIQVTQVSVPEGVINFGIGQPHEDLLPIDKMAQAASHCLNKGNRSILQYGMQQGADNFRIALSQFLGQEYGAPVDADHLFITAGISQTLDLICSLLTEPGDTIFIEEPSYFLALRIFADYKLNIVGIPVDQDGLIIEALEEKLAEHRPVFLYTIPVFHNPAGVTLSAVRREQLIKLSEQYDFLIVADEVYQLLAYTIMPPPPMATCDTSDRVISLGSFSKILAPGLRLGWMQSTPALLEPFLVCGFLDSGGGLNPFVSSIVNSVIELGLQQEHLNYLRKVYRDRIVALSGALRQRIPSLTFSEPDGGYFIWSHLPDGTDAEALLAKAEQHKVGFQPGIKFSSMNGLRNYLRFSFAYYGADDLVEGIERLAKVFT